MDISDLIQRIHTFLPYEPNQQQEQLIAALARFCGAPVHPDGAAFLLNGYAGTGKTSVVGALVKALREIRVPVVLLAPTGRAAKVFGAYSGTQASTIHRRIYRCDDDLLSVTDASFPLASNTLTGAIFIVDEASMIGGGEGAEGANLLEDLIFHVGSGSGCRIVFLGDTAQLPPVGCQVSPAMNPDILRSYGLRLTRVTLTEVVRHHGDSGILSLATRLRRAMRLSPLPPLRLRLCPDVCAVESNELADEIADSYRNHGLDQTLIITPTNRRASMLNAAVRTGILGREEELTSGERLMIVKNDYYWGARIPGVRFLANGDMATVVSVHGVEERYGMRFADVTLRLPDRGMEFDCKIHLDLLSDSSGSLSGETVAALRRAAMSDPLRYAPSIPMSERLKLLHKDPYCCALQVKYAYAVTCHKAQGGQWESVFVDMGGVAAGAIDQGFHRWLYTAVTRATRRLHLIDPPSELL